MRSGLVAKGVMPASVCVELSETSGCQYQVALLRSKDNGFNTSLDHRFERRIMSSFEDRHAGTSDNVEDHRGLMTTCPAGNMCPHCHTFYRPMGIQSLISYAEWRPWESAVVSGETRQGAMGKGQWEGPVSGESRGQNPSVRPLLTVELSCPSL